MEDVLVEAAGVVVGGEQGVKEVMIAAPSSRMLCQMERTSAIAS